MSEMMPFEQEGNNGGLTDWTNRLAVTAIAHRAGVISPVARLCLVSVCFVALTVFYPLVIRAQNPSPNVQYTNRAVDLGLRGNLTVNPSTRAVEIQIPLGSYIGRAGFNVPISISYSSKVHRIKYEAYNPGQYGSNGVPIGNGYTMVTDRFAEYSSAGWTSSVGFPVRDYAAQGENYDMFGQAVGTDGQCPGYACLNIDRITFRMPDGSTHELRSSDQPRSPGEPIIDNYYSVDGSRMRYQTSTQKLFMADGSCYDLGPNSKYVDRNGNTITDTDTLGRPISYPPLSSTTGNPTYSLPGLGRSLDYTFRWRNLGDAGVLTSPQALQYVADSRCPVGNGSYSPHLFSSDPATHTCIVNADALFNPVVLYQIVLPTGQAYTFTYNIYGEIDKVVLPTGGYERYEYDQVAPLTTNMVAPYLQANRGVSRRYVSATGLAAGEVLWQYSGGGGSVSITAPDLSLTTLSMFTDASLSGTFGYSPDQPRAGRTFSENYYSPPDASNTTQLLRRHLSEWSVTGSNATSQFSGAQVATRNARLTKEVEIIFDASGSALAKTTTHEYDLTYQFSTGVNETATNEYDYYVLDPSSAPTIAVGSVPTGTLRRRTEKAYLEATNSAYRDRNLLGIVTSVVTKDAANPSRILAQSTIAYDEPNYPLYNYGAITGWTDPGTTIRGNATTVSRWIDTTNSWIQSHTQYDQAGSPINSWDPKGNLTQVGYSSGYAYAYPTLTISPVPDPTGAYGSTTSLTASTVYDFSTGLVTSTTDANNKTMTFEYNDPLNRQTRVNLPDGGYTRHVYVDTHQCGAYVETRTLLETSGRETDSWRFFDGLGRPYLVESDDGQAQNNLYLRVDTQYDSMGRAWRASNPYRSSGCTATPNPSGRWTQTTFDGLSRPTQVLMADNAKITTSYGNSTSGFVGTTVTVTDPELKTRKSVTDALGRLTAVYEDTNGVNYLTSYGYDELSNLRRVDQGSQRRFFMYDSLGHLIRAKNPEQDAGSAVSNITDPVTGQTQWSMAYGYDNDGNLTARVDARNITTNYGYDALNRNISVTYTGSSTPTVYRYYDSATNGRGRLYWNQSVGLSANVFAAYDAMGRPTQFRQRFWVNGDWGDVFNIARTYDYAGHVLTQTNPSGHTQSYAYDIAGRMSNYSGNLGDGVTRTYSSGISYSELGGLQQEQFGTQTPLYHKLHYNVRGQLNDIRLSSVAWDTDQWNWNRGAIVNYYSTNDLSCPTPECRANSGSDNSGNLIQSQHWIPGDDQFSSYTWTNDSYTYDGLNRLKSVTELPGTSTAGYGPQAFVQTYHYDQWGNRTIEQSQTTTNVPHPDFSVDAGSNRLIAPAGSTYSYDAAGNQSLDNYGDGSGNVSYSRSYDAENRMVGSTANYFSPSLTLTSNYTYDADGRRVKRNANGDETWQVYGMDGELLAEYKSGAAIFLPTKEYGYRGGELLVTMASGDDTRLARFVTNLYYGAKQTDPTSAQLQDGVNQLAAAGAQGYSQLLATATQIARGLFTGTNYEAANRTDQQYVADLYYTYLQRAPDDGGLGYWTGQAAGNRANVCNGFEASSEFQTLVSTLYGTATSDNQRTDQVVNNFYLAAYGTSATSAQLQQQRDALNAAAAVGLSQVQAQVESMGRSLFAAQVSDYSISDQQFVTNLYEAFLQRGPDAGGLGFWTSIAAGGSANRQNVLNAFAPCGPARELAGTLYREAFWLVSDQLGTPRMIADKSGSMAGIKRHDYLPFGEELFGGAPSQPGLGGRTTTQGYAADSTRQKFTSKERDNETGLDYFGARYYSSMQGRFTSPDEFAGGPRELFILGTGDQENQALPYAEITNPQSLNKYTYVYNNPLRFIDPDGHQGEESWMTRLLRWFARQSDPQQEAEQQRRGPLSMDADKVTAQVSGEIAKNTLRVFEEGEKYGLDFGATNLGRQIGKGNTAGTALAGVMIAVNVLSLGKGEEAVVLGESMETRVLPAAEKLGAGTYGGRAIIEENVRWVEGQIGKGKTVLDIGLDATRNASKRSPFYAAEVQTLLKHGFKRVEAGTIQIEKQTFKVYQWVRN